MLKIEDVRIDPEFSCEFADSHSQQQIDGLIADIKANGFLDPVKVWKEERILLDGHTRHWIWGEHFKGKGAARPAVVELSFPNRDAAKRWFILDQLNRRNLPPDVHAYYVGAYYNQLKKDDSSNLKRGVETPQGVPVGKSYPPEETAEKRTSAAVADAAGVSEKTVRNNAAYATAIDAIGAVNGKAKADILSGSIKLDRKSVVAIGKMDRDDIATAIRNIRNGREWDDDGVTEESTPAIAIIRDAIERPVPTFLRGQHAAAAVIASTATRLDAVRREVESLAAKPGGEFLNLSAIQDAITRAKRVIMEARYYTECPKCKGTPKADCGKCSGHGYLPHGMSGLITEDERKWLEAA